TIHDVRPLSRARIRAQLRDEQAKSMQGLPQVVTCRCQESGFRLIGKFELHGALLDLALERRVQVLKLCRHAVELIAERLKLVAGIDRYSLREIAATDPGRAVAQHADRNDHSPCQKDS